MFHHYLQLKLYLYGRNNNLSVSKIGVFILSILIFLIYKLSLCFKLVHNVTNGPRVLGYCMSFVGREPNLLKSYNLPLNLFLTHQNESSFFFKNVTSIKDIPKAKPKAIENSLNKSMFEGLKT